MTSTFGETSDHTKQHNVRGQRQPITFATPLATCKQSTAPGLLAGWRYSLKLDFTQFIKEKARGNVQTESINFVKMIQCHPIWGSIRHSYQLQA
ncbi:hypothetical protein [Nostoc sp. MG11]|uniref:hypothetical protein n=1 Tax=Nostoc sp. MG11 TaxID=2721166 RepID=UPI00186673BC|nr:hypothetical protein [Nostoc sp. MG11]